MTAGLLPHSVRELNRDTPNRRLSDNPPTLPRKAIAHPLAAAKINLEAARPMTQKALLLYHTGRDDGQFSNMAKLTGVDAGPACLDAAIQTHGGNGVAVDYHVANYLVPLAHAQDRPGVQGDDPQLCRRAHVGVAADVVREPPMP
jgi:alkylation response protein AidB-like acyl-CoA dehydrogenase